MVELVHAIEAEENILGCMLLSPVAGEQAAASLVEDCFYLERNAQAFSVMKEMLSNGIPTEPVTVDNALRRKGLSEDVGGRVRLSELVALAPPTASIGHYIKIVRDAWKVRLVQKKIAEIEKDILGLSGDEAVQALDEASLEIEQLTDERHELVVSMSDLVQAKRKAIEAPEAVRAGVPAPFSFLSELIGGRLYVLAGYQGGGKTAGAIQFASTAAEAGEKVGVASIEMSQTDLLDRWACQRTGLPYWKVARPHLLDPRERAVLEQALDEMQDWKVDVIDDEFVNPTSLRRYQRTGKYDLLIVDHLHRMKWKDRHDLENNIRSITNIAREFDVPVLLLAQLSRAGDYTKPFPVPSMRQLRETAMLEAEASSVWFVYREPDEHHVFTSRSQFVVAKNRYGRVGSHVMWFDDASQSFKEQDWEPVEVVKAEDEFPF